MDFEEFNRKTTREIEEELAYLLKEWRSEVKKIDVKLLPLLDKFIISCNGGKRIRGNLVVLGYGLGKRQNISDVIPARFARRANAGIQLDKLDSELDPRRSLPRTPIRGGDDRKKSKNDIFKIAAVYEMLHSAILAHDDIIDQSLLRRGQPSLYKAFGGNHYGVSQALSLGDAVFFLAFKIISESSFDDNKKNKAVSWLAKILTETAIGEMLDVERGDANIIMKLKTAKYTVSGPLVLGAILAGADQQLLKNLESFGENLGIAFQIQDDILGIFGSEETLGKSVSSDIEEGKNTILFAHAFKNTNTNQHRILEKLYGRGKIDHQQAAQVRQVFEKTGAVDFARKEAERYLHQALKMLPKMTKDEKMSKILHQLAESLVRRSK